MFAGWMVESRADAPGALAVGSFLGGTTPIPGHTNVVAQWVHIGDNEQQFGNRGNNVVRDEDREREGPRILGVRAVAAPVVANVAVNTDTPMHIETFNPQTGGFVPDSVADAANHSTSWIALAALTALAVFVLFLANLYSLKRKCRNG